MAPGLTVPSAASPNRRNYSPSFPPQGRAHQPQAEEAAAAIPTAAVFPERSLMTPIVDGSNRVPRPTTQVPGKSIKLVTLSCHFHPSAQSLTPSACDLISNAPISNALLPYSCLLPSAYLNRRYSLTSRQPPLSSSLLPPPHTTYTSATLKVRVESPEEFTKLELMTS